MAPKTSKREDGAYTVGPPPDGRSVAQHLDELAKPAAARPMPEWEFQRCQLVGAGQVFDDEGAARSALKTWNQQGFGFETRMYKRSVRGGGVKVTVFVLVTRVVRS